MDSQVLALLKKIARELSQLEHQPGVPNELRAEIAQLLGDFQELSVGLGIMGDNEVETAGKAIATIEKSIRGIQVARKRLKENDWLASVDALIRTRRPDVLDAVDSMMKGLPKRDVLALIDQVFGIKVRQKGRP